MIFFWVFVSCSTDRVFASSDNSVPISFGEKNGKVSFNNDDNSIRIERKVDGGTIRVQYNILSPAIRDIIRVNLAAGKFNSENSVIVNQLGTETISGEGVNFSDPVLLYDLVYTNDADIKTNSAKNDLYVSDTSTLSFKKGLIVLNKKFTDAFVNKNKSVFVAKVGFKVEDSDFPFMVANIAGTSGNLSNSYVTSFVLAESLIIVENKYVLTENNNLVKNAFNTSNNNINLIDVEDTVIAGSSLVSYNDKYTESYAKTSNGSINVKKNVINISGTETGGAFFDSTGGDVIIDTVATGDNGSIIIVIDGTKKIGGFVKTNRKVNIKTGTITVDAEILNNSTGLGMIDKSSSFIESNEIDATIGNLIIKKHEGYEGDNITLKKSFFKGYNESKVKLGRLELDGVSFDSNVFLMEANKVELTIENIKTAELEKVKDKLFIINENTESIILNLVIKGDGTEFSGFDYSGKPLKKATFAIDTSAGKFISNNVFLKSTTDNLDLTFDFTGVNTDKLIFSNNNSYLVDSAGGVTVTISGINEDLINKLVPQMVKTDGVFVFGGFNFSSNNKIIDSLNISELLGNIKGHLTTLKGSLVENNNNTTVTLPYGGLYEKYLFSTNELALVKISGNGKIIVVDNSSNGLHISKLSVFDDTFTNTALVLMTGNEAHTARIKAKEFTLENSKIGAIVIDENIDSNGSGIKIISTEDLTISNNEFLQSFVVGPKQDIIITGGVDRYTDIWGNFVRKGMNTEKTVVIGNSLSSETIFGNFAKKDTNMENYLITASKGIKFLGKKIIIDKSITSDFSGSSYGLFNADDGNIEIGDDNTETIAISGNETKQKYDANLMMANGDISFKSKESINFALDKNTWDMVLFADKGEVSFVSKEINISGNRVRPNYSNLTSFINSRILTIGEETITESISISSIALKADNKYFFKINEGIKISGKENSSFIITDLASNLSSDDGAVFVAGDKQNENNNNDIQVNIGSLNINKVDVPGSTIFRQNNKNSEDIIAINNINFGYADNSGYYFLRSNSLYYGIGKSFKMHGYSESDYMNLNYYYFETYGKAIIKFGSEEDNANEVQYNANAFTMNIGNFKLNPISVSDNTKAGIIFTNPRYIGTDNNGNIKETNGIGGDLKITIADGGILDLTMPNNLPSIAVVAKKQDYGDGTDKKVFEFGETIIEGTAGNKGANVKMSGYTSLETSDFNNVSEYKNITAGDEVGKSKLTIGDNVREFDTGASGSQYILHEFEMKGGMMIVRLNNKNKNVNLFKWAGDYRTLSDGAGKIGTSVDKGKIILTDKVKLDIEGDFLEGKFILASPDNFEFVYNGENFKDLLDYDSDKTFETREVECFGTEGFVVTLGLRSGKDLVKSLIENGGLNNLEAEIFTSSYEISRSIANGGKGSGNSNFDNFSSNISKLAKEIFKKRQDKTKITSIINNVQMPDANENNSGMTGTIGLSSLKTVTDVLSDRIFENVASVNSADSGMMLFASANGGNGIAKRSNNSIGVFAKFNYGFGKLEASDGDRNIRNFGLLIGSDFGLLENKMILGASFMLDINSLEGSYRESRINSLIMSLYSKYDILESVNGDKLFIYGIVSYAKSSEKEDTSFKENSINPENGIMYVINLANNKSDKSADIIVVDVLGGYKFNNIGITPELGIGFISGSRDSYQDDFGQNISSKDNIYLSLKTNVRYDIPMGNLSDIIAISLKLGISCDILSNGSNGFDVETPAGLKYHVDDVKGADRLSFSYGVNISYNINSSSKLSLSYNGTKTTNLLNNKFSFEYRYKIK